jgi:16S rRNA (uracil1498-N3)-methyltransferase
MRLTRVYVDAPLASGMRLTLPAEAASHLTRVLRLEAGDACVLFNGQGGEYAARIGSVSRREVIVEVGAHDAVERESPLRIVLLQGLARGERMDTIVQKATELGVTAIRPVHTLHSGVRLDPDQTTRKLAHWRGVAASACEQCHRNTLPQILAPLPLEQALAQVPDGLKLTLSPTGIATDPRALTTGIAAAEQNITLLIGPEGGLAASEETMASAAGFIGLLLGPRVLRTETASLAVIATLQALAGDFTAGAPLPHD